MTNTISRFAFLRLAIAAIASRTLLTCPALAAALDQVGPMDSQPVTYQRKDLTQQITETVRLGQLVCVAHVKAMQEAKTLNRTIILDTTNEAAASLITFMLDNFDPASADCNTLRLLLDDPGQLGITGSMLNEIELAKLIDGAISVAVLLELSRNKQAWFQTVSGPSHDPFARFVNAYHGVVYNEWRAA